MAIDGKTLRRSFICLEATRQCNGQTSTERRDYLSSLDGRDAAALLLAVGDHWSIENRLHWRLRVCFGDDDNRVRQGHGADNLARHRRVAVSLLHRESTFKASLKRDRLRSAYTRCD